MARVPVGHAYVPSVIDQFGSKNGLKGVYTVIDSISVN